MAGLPLFIAAYLSGYGRIALPGIGWHRRAAAGDRCCPQPGAEPRLPRRLPRRQCDDREQWGGASAGPPGRGVAAARSAALAAASAVMGRRWG